MNSFSSFGIFLVVLFAYNTPAQGQTFTVDKVLFNQGKACTTNRDEGRYTRLSKLSDNLYEIRESVGTETVNQAKVEIQDFHTIIRNTVTFGTRKNTIQIELQSENDAQQLFELAARDTLRRKMYSFKVSAVYEYNVGRILGNVSLTLSGFTSSVSDKSNRHMVHTRSAEHSRVSRPSALQPYLLWTMNRFNYCDFNKRSIVLALSKPVEGTDKYYLVEFDKESDLNEWKDKHGKYRSENFWKSAANSEVLSYFRQLGIDSHLSSEMARWIETYDKVNSFVTNVIRSRRLG